MNAPALPFLPFALPEIGDEEIAEVVDTLKSGWVTTGPKAKRFEVDVRTGQRLRVVSQPYPGQPHRDRPRRARSCHPCHVDAQCLPIDNHPNIR